jgi:OOP family OmpA-OmpF porin
VLRGDGTGVIAGVGIIGASMFDFDSSELNEEGIANIEEYRKKIGPELTDAYMVVIIGHTDNSGDPEYNLWLSRERAKIVADYLISKGHDASKMITTGKGETKPIASNDTEEERAKNRRVEILVLGRVEQE